MRDLLETYRGVAHPWLCDAMGHLNTRHYLAMFDDAGFHFFAALGYSFAWLSERREGWADVRLEMDLVREVALNRLVVIRSGVARVGNSSLTCVHEMRDAETDDLVARLRAVTVYFDLQVRKSRRLPDVIRKTANDRLIAGEDQGSTVATANGSHRQSLS